jgi:hypothetical protein
MFSPENAQTYSHSFTICHKPLQFDMELPSEQLCPYALLAKPAYSRRHDRKNELELVRSQQKQQKK